MATVADYRSLIPHCIKVISTYDPTKLGPDSHIEAYLSSPDLKTVSNCIKQQLLYVTIMSTPCEQLTESNHTFISEVFAGCVQYNAMIKVRMQQKLHTADYKSFIGCS